MTKITRQDSKGSVRYKLSNLKLNAIQKLFLHFVKIFLNLNKFGWNCLYLKKTLDDDFSAGKAYPK